MEIVDTNLIDPGQIFSALRFAEEAEDAVLQKIRNQHNSAIQEVSDRLDEYAQHATRVKYPDMLRDDILLGDMRVVIHTRKEVYENSVRFVTAARFHAGGDVQNLHLGAFNVRNPV